MWYKHSCTKCGSWYDSGTRVSGKCRKCINSEYSEREKLAEATAEELMRLKKEKSILYKVKKRLRRK